MKLKASINYDKILQKYKNNISLDNQKFELEISLKDTDQLAIFEENQGQLTDIGETIISRLSKLLKYSSNYLGITIYTHDNNINPQDKSNILDKNMKISNYSFYHSALNNKWQIINERTQKILSTLFKNGFDMEKIVKIDNFINFIPEKNDNLLNLANKKRIVFHLLDDKNDISHIGT
jgi:hypothetical protein